MNPPPEILPGAPAGLPGDGGHTPPNWREALMSLLASRAALAQLELKSATLGAGKRAGLLGAGVFFLFFAWALFLTGGIAAISETSDWPWGWIALAAGGLHLLAGLLLVKFAIKPQDSLFPVTRAEFQKDREWIETLHSHPTSKD